jgi:hypothetical protein
MSTKISIARLDVSHALWSFGTAAPKVKFNALITSASQRDIEGLPGLNAS